MNVWEKQQAVEFSEVISHWASEHAKKGLLHKANALKVLADRQRASRYDLRPSWMGALSADWTYEQFLGLGERDVI